MIGAVLVTTMENYLAKFGQWVRSSSACSPRRSRSASGRRGASVRLSRRLLMRHIVLPQTIRIIGPLGNFFVSIFKDSALVSVITMRDLMFSGQLLASATYKHFEIFAMVAVIYFLISYPTAKFVEWIEAKIDITRRPVVIGMRG